MSIAKFFPARRPLLGLLLLIVSGPSSLAQSPSDLSELSLEQLAGVKVYSASRHMQSSGEAPSAVTVVTADDIEQHGYRTLADVLQTVRGFNIYYNRTYSGVGIRGLARPGDFNTRVLLLVDGHRLNDNVYDEAMLGTEFPVDLALIRRIEIIRGPVSSLYGSNAFFAVVNIITRRGNDLRGLELSSEAGSFNTYSGRISYGSKVRQLDFLISGSFYGSKGPSRLYYPEFDAPETNQGISRHADDDQLGSGMVTASYRDFTFQAVYGTREKGVPTAPYGTVFNDAGTRVTDNHGYFDLHYEHAFPESWEVMARVFADRYTYQGIYIYASPDDPTQRVLNLDYADGKWWGAELQGSRTLLRRHRATLGGEYRDNVRQNQRNFDLEPYQLVLDDRRSSFVGAFYVQDEFQISKSVTLNAGVRYDYYSAIAASTDPRAALIFRPRKNTAFKLIYGEAFRAPNVYEKYYWIAPNVANPDLRPEKIRTTEFVWEQAMSNHFWITASAFHNNMHGLITQESQSDGSLIFRNLQDVSSTGMELEAKTRFSSGLEATASYTFQNVNDQTGDSFPNNFPKNLAKLSVTQPLFRQKLFLSLDAQYRGRIEGTPGYSVSPVPLFDVTVFGRGIGKHANLSASVYNLLDKKYFDPAAGDTLQQVIQQNGRTFRVKLTWHFGE